MKIMCFVLLITAGSLISCSLGKTEVAKKKVEAEARSGLATVGGQVRRPGPVELRAGATLYEVIQYAGGVTEFGAERRIKLFRSGETLVFDLRDDQQKMTVILPNDTIEVPQKNLIGR